jgi:hypothetical protein
MENKSNKYYCGGNSSLALRTVRMDNTKVSLMYFSNENIKRIQKQIKNSVYEMSNGRFKMAVDQDEADLIVTMRMIFLEYGRNLDTQIVRQVKELNKKTIEYIMPDLMTNLKQYYGYMKDISNPLQPIDRPLNVSNSVKQSLPPITSIWNF